MPVIRRTFTISTSMMEKFSDSDKDTLKNLLADGTAHKRKIYKATINLALMIFWKEIN